MLKIYVYGYINQIQSSRRLERETARNVEMMWLTGRLAPDFKTIADFRKDNGPAIRSACRQFVALCRGLNLFTQAIVAIDGSRFKAVNSRDRSFSRGSIERRMEQVEASIERYLSALEHEAVLDAMQERLDRAPKTMRIRRQTAEHPFGTIKAWMGATHFKLRTLEKVRTEMSLHVLAYNLKRMIATLGVQPLIQAMRAA